MNPFKCCVTNQTTHYSGDINTNIVYVYQIILWILIGTNKSLFKVILELKTTTKKYIKNVKGNIEGCLKKYRNKESVN